MNEQLLQGSTVGQLASLIEHDVKSRGLSAGESYLTAQQVGQSFQVHPRTASRAMTLLAERGVLVRKRGAGTFVGPKAPAAAAVQAGCIHLLVSPDRKRMGLPLGDLVDGVLEASGTPNVQCSLLPTFDQAAYVRGLIEKERAGGSLAGMVLVGCRREIQEAVLAGGVPAVVFGGVYASTSSLPSVDVDQFDSGRQLAQYLLGRGHQRLALVTRELWLPGDNLHHDGISRALAKLNMRHGSLIIRCISTEAALVADAIAELLAGDDRPTGLICRGPLFAEAAQTAAHELGLRLPQDVEVVFDHWTEHSHMGLPHVYPELDYRAQAAVVGKMLRQLMEGTRPDSEHVVVPVRSIEATEEADHEES